MFSSDQLFREESNQVTVRSNCLPLRSTLPRIVRASCRLLFSDQPFLQEERSRTMFSSENELSLVRASCLLLRRTNERQFVYSTLLASDSSRELTFYQLFGQGLTSDDSIELTSNQLFREESNQVTVRSSCLLI